METEPLKT